MNGCGGCEGSSGRSYRGREREMKETEATMVITAEQAAALIKAAEKEIYREGELARLVLSLLRQGGQ